MLTSKGSTPTPQKNVSPKLLNIKYSLERDAELSKCHDFSIHHKTE